MHQQRVGTSDGTCFLGSLRPRFHCTSSCLPTPLSHCLLQILLTWAILPRICPYKLLQHLGEQGECKQADGERGQKGHSLRSTYRAPGTVPDALRAFPRWLLTRAPLGPRLALPHSGWVTLGRGSQLHPELLFPWCKTELYQLLSVHVLDELVRVKCPPGVQYAHHQE